VPSRFFERILTNTPDKSLERVADLPYAAVSSFRYPFAEGEREKLRVFLSTYPPESTDYRLGFRGAMGRSFG